RRVRRADAAPDGADGLADAVDVAGDAPAATGHDVLAVRRRVVAVGARRADAVAGVSVAALTARQPLQLRPFGVDEPGAGHGCDGRTAVDGGAGTLAARRVSRRAGRRSHSRAAARPARRPGGAEPRPAAAGDAPSRGAGADPA